MRATATEPRVTKADASGKVTYIGPDRPKRWRRQKTDDKGNFEIVEDSYIYTDARGNRKRGGRPMGCVMPVRRPGRYVKLEEPVSYRVWVKGKGWVVTAEDES